MKKIILFLLAVAILGSCKKQNSKRVPTIAFTVNARALGDADYTLPPPLSNSSGAFTYTSSNAAIATINGSVVSIKGLGTTTITAAQAATDDFTDVAVSQTLTVVPAGTYVLGQAIKGGIIYYINGTGIHGFMVSDVDVSAGLPWSNGPVTVANAGTNNLGGGVTNTANTIAALGTTAGNYAALACKNYNGGGYTDWYLPCTAELTYIRLRKDLIGGIPDTNYWTSTEVTATPATASLIYFGAGSLTSITTGSTTTTSIAIYAFSKLTNFSVRAVRAF